VEFTVDGQFVSELSVDAAAGGAFGLATMFHDGVVTLAAVDDNTSSLLIWTIPAGQ